MGRPDPALRDNAARLLMAVSQGMGHEVRRDLEPLLRERGIASMLDLALLGRLAWQGAQRPVDLAHDFHCPFSTLSGSLERLVKEGLVVRRPHPEDGRSHVLEATEGGRAALQEAQRGAMAHLAHLLAELDDRTVGELADVLERLADLMIRRGSARGWLGAMPGVCPHGPREAAEAGTAAGPRS